MVLGAMLLHDYNNYSIISHHSPEHKCALSDPNMVQDFLGEETGFGKKGFGSYFFFNRLSVIRFG